MSSPGSGSPELSVLLPCRDAAEHLPECIASLQAQSCRDFEVLAVDDGSADGTGRILRRWAHRDPRVRLTSSPRPGLVPSLNRAAALARAPLLLRMDADDVALPGRFAAQLAFMRRRPGLAASGTGVEIFPAAHVRSGYRRYERWLNGLREPDELRRDLFVECPIAHPTLAIRRRVLRALGGYRSKGWPEDYDLVLRLHARGLRVANHPEVLLRWRVTEGRHSRSDPAYSPGAFRRCKVHHLLRSGLARKRPLVVWGAGPVGKSLARELAVRGVAARAFVDLDPRKIGQEIHGAPVLSVGDLLGRLPEGGEAPGRRPLLLLAVGSPGARAQIRETLWSAGRREGRDFVAVA